MPLHCGTDRHIYLRSSPSKSSRVARIDVRNGKSGSTSSSGVIERLPQRPWLQSRHLTVVISRFSRCGAKTTSGMRATLASSSAVRQCSRVKIRGPLWQKRKKLSRKSKIGTSKVHVLCMKNSNKWEARSMIFIIICLFSYWPRQNIRGIEGSISKKKFLRKIEKSNIAVRRVVRPCLGHYDFHCIY